MGLGYEIQPKVRSCNADRLGIPAERYTVSEKKAAAANQPEGNLLTSRTILTGTTPTPETTNRLETVNLKTEAKVPTSQILATVFIVRRSLDRTGWAAVRGSGFHDIAAAVCLRLQASRFCKCSSKQQTSALLLHSLVHLPLSIYCGLARGCAQVLWGHSRFSVDTAQVHWHMDKNPKLQTFAVPL